MFKGLTIGIGYLILNIIYGKEECKRRKFKMVHGLPFSIAFLVWLLCLGLSFSSSSCRIYGIVYSLLLPLVIVVWTVIARKKAHTSAINCRNTNESSLPHETNRAYKAKIFLKKSIFAYIVIVIISTFLLNHFVFSYTAYGATTVCYATNVTSKKFHEEDCRFLSYADKIKKTTVYEAKQDGYRKCSSCYDYRNPNITVGTKNEYPLSFCVAFSVCSVVYIVCMIMVTNSNRYNDKEKFVGRSSEA